MKNITEKISEFLNEYDREDFLADMRHDAAYATDSPKIPTFDEFGSEFDQGMRKALKRIGWEANLDFMRGTLWNLTVTNASGTTVLDVDMTGKRIHEKIGKRYWEAIEAVKFSNPIVRVNKTGIPILKIVDKLNSEYYSNPEHWGHHGEQGGEERGDDFASIFHK
jgi:hypothetical protein